MRVYVGSIETPIVRHLLPNNRNDLNWERSSVSSKRVVIKRMKSNGVGGLTWMDLVRSRSSDIILPLSLRAPSPGGNI